MWGSANLSSASSLGASGASLEGHTTPMQGPKTASRMITLSQDPREPAFYADPYPFYARVHAAGGRFVWREFGFRCYANHADVSALLRDRRFGRQILHVMTREELGWPEPPAHLQRFEAVERYSLLSLEPPDHTRLRTLVNRAFVSRAIERLEPAIERLCHELIDGFGRGPVDLISAYGEVIPVTVIADLIGVPRDRCPDLLAWSHAMVRMYQFGRTEALERAADDASAAFDEALRALIAERRRQPADDLVSHLIAAESAEGRLTEDEMVSTLILLLNAGHEATVHVIGNGVLALLAHGADLSAFTDQERADAAVEEVLRFDTPLHMFTRHALEDVQLHGETIRRGEEIGLLLGAANRDPTVYSNPGSLRLDRREAMHVSFGGGIHFCIGAPLARLEIAIALKVLFQRLPDLTLAEPPRFKDVYHFRGVERLMVRPQ